MVTTCHFKIFKSLLAADLKIFYEQLKDKVIDVFIWVAITLVVMAYIMPSFGLVDYGTFQLAGLVASAGLFELWPSVMGLVTDFENDRIISFHLILPIKPSIVLLKTLCFYALNACFLGLLVIPMGKIILWNQFDLTLMSLFQTLIIITLSGIFYGIFTLWIASRIPNLSKVGNVWMRFIFPMWFLGGFQFSWYALYGIVPYLAYLNMLNPMNVVMEGTRAALLGPDGYLPFWLSVGVLSLFNVLCWVDAYRRLKKRLDFV